MDMIEWKVFKRGRKFYVETAGNQVISKPVSDSLNNGGIGYRTEAAAQAEIDAMLTAAESA